MKHSRKHHKGRKHHRKHKGMHGLGNVLVETGKDTLNPLAIVLGYTAGAFAGRMLDKIDAITPDATATGFQWKSLIKPIGLLGVGVTISGVALHMESKGKSTLKTFIKNFGYGVSVSGVVTGAKLIKPDLFTGLGASNAAVDTKYLAETKQLIKDLITENAKEVDLPSLEGDKSKARELGAMADIELGSSTPFTSTLNNFELETVL